MGLLFVVGEADEADERREGGGEERTRGRFIEGKYASVAKSLTLALKGQ